MEMIATGPNAAFFTMGRIILVGASLLVSGFDTIPAIGQNQPALQITSPTNGTIVNPGQTLTVGVTSNSPTSFPGVALWGEDPIGFVSSISSLPGQFSVTIPSTGFACGTHLLTVEGTPTSGSGPVFASVSVDVERPDLPVSLSAALPLLAFESQGERAPLVLFATYSDGSIFRVTASTYVAYSSSNVGVVTVDVTGAATAVAAGGALITAKYALGGQSLQINIPVTVATPMVAVSPASLTFVGQPVGTTSATQQIALTNVSNGNMNILSVNAAGDFYETDNCAASSPLAIGGGCTINTVFSPTATGTRTGNLSFVDDANIVPVSVPLTGTGTAAQPPTIASLTPNSGALGTVVTISGTNFGSAQGASTVTFNGTTATPTSWSPTSIVAPVPSGATTGSVVVTVVGLSSNGVNFTVQGTTNGIALVQHTSKDAGTTTSSSLTFNSNNAAGNWIGVCVRAGRSGESFTVTDSAGNTYRKAVQINITVDTPNGDTLAIFYAENINAGANTITVSDTVSGGTLRFAILEYTGVATANSLDVTASAQGTSASPNSGNTTTTANGDLLLAAIATADADGYESNGGPTIREFVPAEPNTKLAVEDSIQTAAGVAVASTSLSGSDPWGALLATFKKAHP